MSKKKLSIFWFRRDLRLHDNHGLSQALNGEYPVLPIFIFDPNILDDIKDKQDARVSFIHCELEKMNETLATKGSGIKCFYTSPLEVYQFLFKEYDIQEVYINADYEPYARIRDKEILDFVESQGAEFKWFKDQVIFEKKEIVKADNTPYLVYTPYSKKWLSVVTDDHLRAYPNGLTFDNWVQTPSQSIITLSEMGFEPSAIQVPPPSLSEHTLNVYEEERNFPPKDSTSRLGVHLRFGTVSCREIARQAKGTSEVFLKELIWREFFMMILYCFPKVVEHNFNAKYDGIQWRNNKEEFEKWKKGETGFLLVDAGMRELNATGFMHNRVRMLVASFLTKHLLIDWKWGEAYFAEKLLDYELASNNGNWQWAAGTGVDAQPYFRVFNPITQVDKFDKEKKYIKKWVNDYGKSSYPAEMVDHKMARERAISTFKEALSS